MSISTYTTPFSSDSAVTTYWFKSVLSTLVKVTVRFDKSNPASSEFRLIVMSRFVGTDVARVIFSDSNPTLKLVSVSYHPSWSMSTLHWYSPVASGP